ncbi:MAG: PHP domain-containing protein, partial [Lachnospiraceae bacterium]|nr:PHP domain-containing protein [Lachnospiraceae bacterium]
MGRSFQEVFGNAGIRADLMRLFEDVTVDRVVLMKRGGIAKVCISYDRLITKDHIRALEKELDVRVFSARGLKTRISEDYHLTAQYTPAYVVETYFDSLLQEADERDKLIYTVLRSVKPSVEGNRLLLDVPDSFVARQKERDILEICDHIFQDRFHLPIHTAVSYRERETSRYRAESEQRARHMVESILRENEARSVAMSEAEQAGDPGEELIGKEEKKETTPVVKKTPPAENKSRRKGKGERSSSAGPASGARKLKMSDDPELIYGRNFDGDAEPIVEVSEEIGPLIVRGEVLAFDEICIKKTGSYIFKYTISDYTDSIRVKLFLTEELAEELRPQIKKGDFIKLKGMPKYDDYDKEVGMSNVLGIRRIPDFRIRREDFAARKRVELHCHTKMSDMDACGDAGDILKLAKSFGHTSFAITDHGNVQGFTIASHELKKGDTFKILYGLEAYVVDDTRLPVVNEKGQRLDGSFVVFDIETTGFVPGYSRIIEIGAVKVQNGVITDRFSEFINPGVPIPLEIEKLTSISDSMVHDAPPVDVILPKFLDFCKDCVLVAHNARFDTSFIRHYAEDIGLVYDFTHTDTIEIARLLLRRLGNYKLDHLAKELNIPPFHHHRAVDDAEATAQIFLKLLDMLKERKIETLAQLNEIGKLTPEKVADLYPHHAVLIAKNEVGRRNLYRLVSLSHLKYFNRFPKIPKSELIKYREGLILGSGCSNGELYDAIINGRTEEEISRIVDFYDYLEIQPIENNMYLIEHSKLPTVQSREDLIEINKCIVALGAEHRKPVCATGDVHYIEPE